MSRLFHKKVFWIKAFDIEARTLFNNNYSEHLWEHFLFHHGKHDVTARELDRIINEIMDCKRNYFLYEVETRDNKVVKAVIRTSYDIDYDVCIVFDDTKVRTAWLNRKDDRHNTLDYSKYYNPLNKKNRNM